MLTGAAAAHVRRTPLLDALKNSALAHELLDSPQYIYLGGLMLAVYNVYFWARHNKLVLPSLKKDFLVENLAYFASAVAFGVGLGISGMCDPDRVLKFLDFSGPEGWDPSLMGVMGTSAVCHVFSFKFSPTNFFFV